MDADSVMAGKEPSHEETRRQLEEARQALAAIRRGAIDAVVVSDARGDKVYSLEGSETPYRILVETMNEGAAVLTAQGDLSYGNARLAGMLGTPLEDLVGTSFRLRVAESQRDRFLSLLREARETPVRGEIDVLTPGGETLPALVSLAPGGGKDEAVGMVLTDLSGQREAEREKAALRRQLQHAQKLEAVGRLAGGVAHDFNNMMHVVTGYARRGLRKAKAGSALHDILERILEAGSRSAALTRQLLAFGRRQIMRPVEMDLRERIEEMREIIEGAVGENVRIETRYDEAAGTVRLDPVQVDQILMNLVMNARDAMPEGGSLRITVAPAVIEKAKASGHEDVSPGRYVLFTVADSGTGMDEATRSHIFEPFFTTKAAGEGTGLGLPMVFGTVKQSGGHLEVESAPGEGTVFRLFFPAAGGEAQTRPAAEAPDSAAPGGEETILLLEDEDALRELLASDLRETGYRVLEARDPAEALKRASETEGPIDLLLSDVVLPMMNGPQAGEAIRRIRPGLKALYMSGYAEKDVNLQGLPRVEDAVHLEKPFSRDELGRRVRAALDG